MFKVAIYGKGGVGKSTISSNLSVSFAKLGKKVLHVGCDPKQDSTIRLLNGQKIPTVIETLHSRSMSFLKEGVLGIDCIEAGGPKPGVGCAGRGISAMFEMFDRTQILHKNYDVVVFDVLGDVVCGGFAAPLRKGYAEVVYIVVSDDVMSLYAANRILYAIDTYKSNGVKFGGFIVNTLTDSDKRLVSCFAEKAGIDILERFSHDELIADAELHDKTIVEMYPDATVSKSFLELSNKILGSKGKDVRMLDDTEFKTIIRGCNGR